MTKTQYAIVYAVGFYAGSTAKHWWVVLIGIGAFIAFDWIIRSLPIGTKKSIIHL